MPAPESIRQRCEIFASHREHYRSGGYNETELRREFLDPLFTALGWDAKLLLCILSDFEELAVYDTRVKPEKTDRLTYQLYNLTEAEIAIVEGGKG